MKKAILGLAFLTIASVSFSAAAQQQKAVKGEKAKTECVAKECCKDSQKCDKVKGNKAKAGKKANKFKDGKMARGQKGAKRDLFEGITLTTEQQGRIEALNNAVKVSRQEIKAQAKAAKESQDTTFNMREANKQLRGKYVNDLGEILTSDQMVVFLKNYYVNTPQHKGGKKAMAMKGGKDGKGFKGQKGQRPDGAKVRPMMK